MESEKFSEQYPEILRQLKLLYGKKIMDFEKKYKFDEFWGQTLKGSDFDAKPLVLLLGQYSVGKTSFIEYLLKRKFPGMRIGPEPTTDRFVAVMHGDEDQIIPGNALSVDPEQPFHGTNAFGSSFLSHFEASKCNASILKNITLVDSPGVLSGEKHRLGRSYDFTQVIQWFAGKADLILLLFDGHKLDISDEFKEAIEALKGNDDKVRVVLNKCDQITTQQLMRVYGALMWSLGKVVKTPEVMRVYLGSFWDQPYRVKDNEKLFQMETKDLLEDLLSLPRNSAVRKVNELVKRVRLVRCHAYILSHLRDKMPMLFGREDTKKDLIKNLAREFKEIERVHKIPPGDFPDVRKMQELLVVHDFSNFESRNERVFEAIESVMCIDLPKLMKTLAPQKAQIDSNPFASNNWVITEGMKQGYDELFRSLNPVNGCITGQVASKPLLDCGVAMSDLRQIWELSDIEKDGTLDADEFALAMYLAQRVKAGETVPPELGAKLIPPSKRHRFKNVNFNT